MLFNTRFAFPASLDTHVPGH